MSSNTVLYHFYQMTHIPVRRYRENQLVEEYGMAVYSDEYDQDIRRQFTEGSDGFSYQVTPELLIYGYIRFSIDEETNYVLLGPFCAENDVHKTVVSLSAAFHRPVSNELWRYCESLKTCYMNEFFSILVNLRWTINQRYPVDRGGLYHLFSEHLASGGDEIRISDTKRIYDKNVVTDLLHYVEEGRIEQLREDLKYRSTFIRLPQYDGVSLLRTAQDVCISALSLCARAAIRGGMDYDASIQTSDRFIERIEKARSAPEVEMLRQEMMEYYTEAVASVKRFSVDSELVQKTISFIQAHLSEKLSVNIIAESFHQNAAYLSHHFKEKTGVSITDYIRHEKMKIARKMLKSSDRPLVEIAHLLGYSSQQHFQSQFKSENGMTPGEYRRKKL